MSDNPCDGGRGAPGAPEDRAEKLVQLRLGKKTSRRGALKLAAAGAAAGAAVATAGCDVTLADMLQSHYTKLSDEDKKEIFARLEQRTYQQSGVKVKIGDPKALQGVGFAYLLNLSACNGNRRCVEACARENNLPNDPEIRYIRVLEMEAGTFDLERGTAYFSGLVPKRGKYYMPVQCHQCDNPPCVRACPCQATWKQPDGIVVVDYNWCIGCRYCQVACPYHGRRFNFAPPAIEPDRINPVQAYLSNRIRPGGVVEKCTYCLQRSRKGRLPACLEACPTGARKFGDLNDPDSDVRKIIETKRVYILKEELGTIPRFYYFFSA